MMRSFVGIRNHQTTWPGLIISLSTSYKFLEKQIQKAMYESKSYAQKIKAQKTPSKNQDLDPNSSDSESESQNPQLPKQQIQEPSIEFKDNPIQIKCPFCLQNVRTQIIAKPEFVSILLGFALFVLLPNFLMLIFTLVILQITATRKHRCPMCERELGSDGKFLVFFKDEVYSFALGTNGIIVSKKIISSILIGVAIFALLSLKVNNAYADAKFTDMTWVQFTAQCPYETTKEQCQYGNQGLTVQNWRGYVMRVQDNRQSIKRHFQYAVCIYLKMNNAVSMQQFKERPDLFLTVTTFQAHEWQNSLDKLKHGDEIEFNATFQYLRNSRNIPVGRHLNIIEFNFTGRHSPDIHVYMSEDQDAWFFHDLSGEKLRRHDDDVQKDEKIIEEEVEKELNRLIEMGLRPTNEQKNVVEDSNPPRQGN